MRDLGTSQAIDVFWLTRVATQKPVVAQDPQVAWLRNGFIRLRRHFVTIAKTFSNIRSEIFASSSSLARKSLGDCA